MFNQKLIFFVNKDTRFQQFLMENYEIEVKHY